MPKITITRHHKLDPAQARAAAQKIANELDKRYELACAWDGDDVSFKRAGVSGCMHVGKNEVRLDVQLSLLMTPLKGPIETAINKELDRLFGEST